MNEDRELEDLRMDLWDFDDELIELIAETKKKMKKEPALTRRPKKPLRKKPEKQDKLFFDIEELDI